MKILESPKHKLIAAAVALAALPIVAAIQGFSAAGAARVVLGLAAAAGLAAWFLRHRGALGGARFKLPPRLTVVQRVGLSQRTGLALVEVDGQSLLVVHGDGFARIQRVRKASQPRLVSPRHRAAEPVSALHDEPSAHASNGGLS